MKGNLSIICLLIIALTSFSCSSTKGLIEIVNIEKNNLVIETIPYIPAGSASSKGFLPYGKDSIIWIYQNIKAFILEPKKCDTPQSFKYCYYLKRNDTNAIAKYSMFPKSHFIIGRLLTAKRRKYEQNNNEGELFIRGLKVVQNDSIWISNNKNEIWNFLLNNDKNRRNFKRNGERRKLKNIEIHL